MLLPVRIALKQRNLENGYNHLLNVSHPSSPNYGQHWTKEQVNEVFAPDEESIAAVSDWLSAAGVASDDISVRKGWLAVDIPANDAERLFRAEYFEHQDSHGRMRVGCDRYCIATR